MLNKMDAAALGLAHCESCGLWFPKAQAAETVRSSRLCAWCWEVQRRALSIARAVARAS